MKKQVVVDIGSDYIKIAVVGRGVVLEEKSLALVQNKGSKTILKETGSCVVKKFGSLQANEQIIRPIKEGIIVNEKVAVMMFNSFFKRLFNNFLGLEVIACVSCGISLVERNVIYNVIRKAGAKQVIVLESPVAVAGLLQGNINFIVDIGAEKTEIAIVDKSGIVAGCTSNIGGAYLDSYIVDYMYDSQGCNMSTFFAEKVKKQMATMDIATENAVKLKLMNHNTKNMEEVSLTSQELYAVIQPNIEKLIEIIGTMSYQIPQKNGEEVYNNGLILCGGSAKLTGLAKYIEKALDWRVNLLEDPQNAVCNGGLYYFSSRKDLANVLNCEKI